MDKKRTFLLIHGAAVGGWVFKDVADLLKMYGHEVHRPTLIGLGERSELSNPQLNLTSHIEDVINYIETNKLKDVIIVGHSYGGSVISGVVDKISYAIKHQVYLDTFLLENDESIMDIFGDARKEKMEKLVNEKGRGWLIPREAYGTYHPYKVGHPWKCFIEKISITGARDTVPGSFIDCIDPKGYEHLIEPKKLAEQRVKARGWKTYYMDSDHIPMLKSPQRENLVNILLTIAEKI